MKNRYMIYVTLLVILLSFVLGVTYSYLVVKINNAETSSTISVQGGKLLITYENNSGNIILNNIIPGATTTKQFTLTGVNDTKSNEVITDTNLKYKIGIAIDKNTFSDGALTYSLTKDSTSSSNGKIADDSTGTINQGGTQYIGNGYFSSGANNAKHIYNLTISFPDTNVDQSIDQGASFACHIVIKQDLQLLSEYIATLDKTENGLEIDNTSDNNLRYVGSNPKNYLWFNNEYWRIIGIFNVYNIETKKTENLVKIIRDEPLGLYSWDSSDESISSGFGINEWNQADLMNELNTDYINKTGTSGNTLWYNGPKNKKEAIYDYSKNIKTNYIDKIATIRWNLGGTNLDLSPLESYNQEHGTKNVNNPIDGVKRHSTWDGKIGLIYPSDYGFASIDEICREKISTTNCKNLNWLWITQGQWTLTPTSYHPMFVMYVRFDGIVTNTQAAQFYNYVRPSLFLKPDVMIAGGTGEKERTKVYTIEQ